LSKEYFLKYPAKINYTKQLFQNSDKNYWQEDLRNLLFFIKTMNNHGCSAFFKRNHLIKFSYTMNDNGFFTHWKYLSFKKLLPEFSDQ
jgi:hypothetical protein